MIGRSINDNDGELKSLRVHLRLALKDIETEGERKRR